MVHTVVVVTGTVVGVVDVGVVVVGVSSDSDELLVVVGTVVGVVGAVTMGFVAPARYATRSTETTPEPTRRVWVSLRTRANRRSRCWGVRVAGVKGFPHRSLVGHS